MLIVLGVAAVAILGAAWFAAGSPASSNRESIPAEIAVSAVETGSGSWVRYLITVKNAGDTEFAGDVILMNRQAPAGSAAGQVAPRLPTSIPRFPSSAPDAAYQFHLTLGARQTRTLTVIAPDRYTTVAVDQDPDRALVQEAAVDHAPYIPVAVLTGSSVVTGQLEGVHIDDYVLRLTQYVDVKTVPTSALGWAPYAAVVIDQFDAGSLTEPQRLALRDFVGQGGGLVVAGGTGWPRTLARLPPELAPLRAGGTGNADDGPVLALAARTHAAVVPVALGDTAPGGHSIVRTPDGRPLLSELRYGTGVTVAMAFDPAVEPGASELPPAAWTEAVGRALTHPAGGIPQASTVPGVDPTTAFEFPPLRGAALPSPWLVGPLLLGYLLLVAPVNYLMLRRRLKSPDLLWVTAPVIALVFTAGFYFTGVALQGDLTDEQLQVLKLGPNQSVAEIQYHRILFLTRGRHVIASEQPALAAPLTYDLSTADPIDCGGNCALELTGLRSGQEHVVPAQRPFVIEDGVVYGGVRIVGTAAVTRAPVAVETHLQAVGGRISGTISNRGDRPIHGLVLYSLSAGAFHRTALASLVAPHSAVQVDAPEQAWDGEPNAPLAGSNLRPDAATRLSRAVGVQALTSTGTPWLVGFTDPLPGAFKVDGATPRTDALTVFEAPAAIEKADATLTDFGSRRLASTTGGRTLGGFTDVYDLEVPVQVPPRVLAGYDKATYSSVEIYDWAAQTWRGGSWTDDPTDVGRVLAPLTPAEILASKDGTANLVRLRVREPRVGWGSSLYLLGG